MCPCVTVSSLTLRLLGVCWGVQKPHSSGSSEDPLALPHTTPTLVLLGGSPFLPQRSFQGKLLSGSMDAGSLPSCPGQCQHPARLPGRLGLLTLTLLLLPGGKSHLGQRSQAPACTCSGQKLEQETLRQPQCSSQHQACSSSGLAPTRPSPHPLCFRSRLKIQMGSTRLLALPVPSTTLSVLCC